ncbi:MAG TPA: DUF3298 domain-containing protein [Armatimonadota bacterium]|nr:DUF3298 domain-containing protein [Armatimonadota bacterium]
MPIRLLCLMLLFGALLPGLAEELRYYYTGTVNGALAVQMELSFDGDRVEGHYFYETVGADLRLDGNRTGTALAMEELVDGKVTGGFTGRLSADLRAITGSWVNPDGTRKLPFTATAVAQYKPVLVKRPGYELTGRYPVFLGEGAALQALTKQLGWRVAGAQAAFLKETVRAPDVEYVADFTQEYSIGIAYYHPELISLLVHEYVDAGGAHPNLRYASANYAIAGEQPRLLGLRDLLRGDNPQATLFPPVKADLDRQATARGTAVWELFTADDLSVYTLRPAGFTFYFAPYVAGPYAAGPYQVALPYHAVMTAINWGGPLPLFLRLDSPGAKPGVDPVTGLGAAEAAKLGMDAFAERYLQAVGFTGENATAWMVRQALDTYTALKHAWNDREAKALPAARHTQYTRVRAVMARLLAHRYALEWLTCGGTILYDFATGDAAGQADTLGALIDALRPPDAKDPAARALARADLAAAQAAVAARPRTVAAEECLGDPQDYAVHLSALTRAVADAHALAQELPDRAAALLAAVTLEMAKPVAIGPDEEE